jgi:hypothetical protein
MAPEVVEAFMDDSERDLVYDKRCELRRKVRMESGNDDDEALFVQIC